MSGAPRGPETGPSAPNVRPPASEADGGEDAVQDAEDPGGCPPDQPPGLRRPGLLAAGRPGARLATRPTPTGTPKDPPRRRVTASLAHPNRGSGPGWQPGRVRARGCETPAARHASHQYTRPCTQNAPRRETSPTRKRQPPERQHDVCYSETVPPSAPESDFAAFRGCVPRRTGAFLSAPAVRHVRPAVRHAAGRRFALSQTLDRTSTNTATNAKHRGKNHRELFLAHLAH